MKWQDLVTPARLAEMSSAIQRLQQWQELTYRQPLLENPDAFYQEKERIAAILVDNHLGKLAKKVRLLGADQLLDSVDFLNDWAEIAFYASLWTRFDRLPDGLKLNLIYQSGPHITKRHLDIETRLQDQFVVVGQEWEVEEQLTQRSVYVYGVKSKRFFLILDFSFRKQPFAYNFQIGSVYEGEVVVYPFPESMRISPVSLDLAPGLPDVYESIPAPGIAEIVETYHNVLRINPFCSPFPALVSLRSDHISGEWRVVDASGQEIRMATMDAMAESVFHAVCFRRLVRTVVLLNREGVRPISYYNGEQLLGFGAGK